MSVMDETKDGADKGLPGWANTLLRVGALTLIAVYLVRVLSDLAIGDIRIIRDTLIAHVSAQGLLQTTVDQSVRDQFDFFTTMLALEQRVCLNTANDGVERQACLNPKPLPFRNPSIK
jgi:hypothetical protein